MNWKLKTLLWYVNNISPLEEAADDKIPETRKKLLKVVELGKKVFDRKTEVKEIRNFSVENIPCRLYQNSTAKNQSVIIFYHGGGFVYYNMDSHDYVARRLCKMNNCTVILVDYRLAPEHTFPAAHEDSRAVVEYVFQHAKELNINPTKIIVAGDSAGGNLSACLCHHFKNHSAIKLYAQILIYPWVDGTLSSPSIKKYGKGYLLSEETMKWFQQKYTPNPEDQCNPDVSVIFQTDFSGLPPAFVLTAELDPLKDEGIAYAEKMKTAGVRVKHIDYKQLIHGFFNVPLLSPEASKSYYDIQSFLSSL